MKKVAIGLVAILLAGMGTAATAADTVPQAVSEQLKRIVPARAPDVIRATPVLGLYEVRYGTTVIYLSDDGRFLIDGSVLDLEQRKNLTEESIKGARLEVLNGADEGGMVVYQPKETKRTLTVFTDIDCPYCRRLHEERQALLDAGVKLRYLLYPRAGVGSGAYVKAVNVWCAEDRNQAMDDAKAGMGLENRECETPILDHIRLGATFGLKGTPHIVLDDGDVIGGYMPADKLIERLGLK